MTEKSDTSSKVPPDVQQAFNRVGVVPVVSPPLAELPKFIATEQERWGKIVKQAGLAGTL